ncbi:hypothetical protein BST81_04445 [Leptolyngbya sp. 'hensonii']|uniref:histidine kinase dimerization/phosphoacceptor domain -containing protein n=1 Tax=Leptolyngbya sp. 'hensonii' TaxID=1922337 RepID=UPI00094FA8FB|nr:histidine kinase dimerization/phosphoacceptor domain -containing protein [Leptolyngbya sp. 'hensonii']OLP19525.1 hypothetical protein BST81_04445 [Leptolyngbya sp. 'hensonii']
MLDISAPLLFIPHGHCYLWKPGLVWLHVVGDSLTGLAYYSIPCGLIYFVQKREDLPFSWIFLLFGSFIIACGTTHFLEVWTVWHPTYWLSGLVKVLTAIVSLYTAGALAPLIPRALALPRPAQLEAANRDLEREVADRKRIEEILRQSEARYRAIVEDQTELITRFRPDGTLTFVSESYCRFFRKPREALIGQNCKPLIVEADLDRVAQTLNTLTLEHPVALIENRVIINGEIHWMEWINRALFDQDGQLIEFQAVGRDITQRKQVESALAESQRFIQKIADTTPVILYVYDLLEQRNVYINRDVSTFLGYTPEDRQPPEADGLLTLLHPEDAISLTAQADRWRTAREQDILYREYRLQHKLGEWRSFLCHETLFARTTEGLPWQILGAAVDITAAKQLEEVRKAEEKLQNSLREKDVLLKEIHHRVKNNLQLVYSLLRLQHRHLENQQAAGILLESQNRIKSIALIHEKLYRSEDLARVNLTQYIPSLAAHLFSSYKINAGRIHLETQVDDISLVINTAIPCGLIINELLSNALKYAFPPHWEQEGMIRISLYANSDQTVTLIVEDNGIGIPESFDFATTESLGLRLVKDLVLQLEGTIQLQHYPGTTFHIIFPGDECVRANDTCT